MPGWITLLPAIALILADLAALVASIILIVRHRTTPAILATIGFALLLMSRIADIGRSPLAALLAEQGGMRYFLAANTSIGCCRSAVYAVAIALLVIAIYRAIAGDPAAQPYQDNGDSTEESPEEAM
jgi:hypothetical protein